MKAKAVKISLPCLLILLISSSGSSALDGDWSIQNAAATYGESDGSGSFPPMITCTGNCPGQDDAGSASFQLEACGDAVRSAVPGGGSELDGTSGFNFGSIEVPADFSCGLGTHEMTLKISEPESPSYTWDGEVTSSLTIDTNKDGHPNKGRYIVLRLRGNNDKLEDFFLTNEPWYDADPSDATPFNEFPDEATGTPLPKGALFMGSEADRNLFDKSDEGVWVANYGEVIEPFGSLWERIERPYDTGDTEDGSPGWFAGDNDGQKHVKNTMKTDFSSLSEGPKFDQKCSVASNNYKWRGNCAPLHDNGEYEPQGEIIVASETDTELSDHQSPYVSSLSIDESTYFFVCRSQGGGSDWQGDKPSNSKVVKVRQRDSSVPRGFGNLEDEWEYYFCNEANDWEEVECPPGQQTRFDSITEEIECKNKDPVTIDVEFFNISDAPPKSSGSPLIAGFKVDSSEISKYEDFMGQSLKRIDAECWMGDDDPTPGTSGTGISELPGTSDTGIFRLNYDGSGDAWVLGEIPYRTGFNNNTYSCIWGFSDKKKTLSPDDYGIYESTRYPPLRSVESGKIDVDYSTLAQKRANTPNRELQEGISRNTMWRPYQTGADTRPYIDTTLSQTDMFNYPDEFPYCEQPPYTATNRFGVPVYSFPTAMQAVYQNIICS